jgi:hypothetical protein
MIELGGMGSLGGVQAEEGGFSGEKHLLDTNTSETTWYLVCKSEKHR